MGQPHTGGTKENHRCQQELIDGITLLAGAYFLCAWKTSACSLKTYNVCPKQ